MKIRHLLIGMLAIAGAVACKQDQPVEEPILEVNKTNVAVAATAGESAFEVTANNAWTAAADADWVSLDPASGDGGAKAVAVKVTAEDNTAAEVRTATVTVKAGELTKTLKVTQAAAAAGPGDDVDPDAPTYILVGEAVGGWDVDKNGKVLTLKDGYYQAKGVAVTAKKGMHFTKNNKWEGNVKGLHGLIAPNEIGEVGNNDISLTEDGLYDVYLTEALDKFYFMTDGKLPSEAVEHVEIAVTWGICGAIEGNAWGAASDVELTADGEWLSAKDVTFTEVNFKIRGNNSWADDVKWGTAEKNQACELNKAVAVSTCTEFKDANPSEGDNPNIYIAAGAGTYDVYFSPDKKEVWVMTQGYKPGDEVPETPGPEQPDPETSTWALVGSFNGWDAAGSTAFLAVLDADYFVYYGFEATANTEFKFVKDGKWASQGGAEIGGAIGVAEPNTIQTAGGKNIVIAEAGKYDIYLASDLSKFYVMTEGKLPAEATEPAPVEMTYTVVGTLDGINWSNNAPEGLMTKDGDYYVAKNVPFVTAKTLYGGAEQFEFKVVETGTWNGYGVAAGTAAAAANAEITVQESGENIPVIAPEGAYDVYFDKANTKVWVMEPGYKPGEKDPVQVEVTYTVTGTIKGTAADKKANYWNPSNEAGLMTLEGNYYVAKNVEFDYDYRFSDDASGEDFVKFKICETGTWNAYGQLQDGTINKPNAEIAVELDGKDIYIDRSGVYDVYFDKDNGKVWVMEAGYAPGEEIAKLDGNQWIFRGAETTVLFDLGIAEPGMLSVALPTMDGSAFGLYMIGEYLVEEFDKSSGVVLFVQYDWEFDEFGEEAEFEYSNLTASSVDIVCEAVFGTTAPVTLQKVANPYEIVVDAGGADPVGPIENGEYWFFNGEKVMAPLAEGETTGVLPAGNVISGASTEKNIFTLTYDPDWSYYTIQDSYGRYLGQTDETGNITVTSVLPTDETYAFYLWCVEPGYGEACSIYNAAYYYDITYSAANNNWVLVDGGYEYPETLPTLVKAENPVEEPVEPEGPKVVTVAEFLAATDNTIEYQVSGTITGIYQAYNASYGNISIYIADETGEMLAYRLSCEGISDPANTITKGDLITVKGKRTLYNETPQMAQGCVIVEHTDVVIEEPAGSATLSFADKANRTTFTTSQQVWEQNGIKLINDKGSSTSNVADYYNPARFYKSSKITVEYAGMTKIEFVCNNGSYATALKSSITSGTVTVNGSVVTVELGAASDSYVISSLTGGQVRMDSITVYAE